MVRPDFDVDQALADSAVFGPLPEAARMRLAQGARIERYERPTLLNAAGQPLGALRLVIAGHIEMLARSDADEGDEATLVDIGPGEWVTWMGCFARQPPQHDFYSSSACCCMALPSALVRSTVHAHPEAYVRVIEQMGKRMRLLMEWTSLSAMLGSEQRMAKLLHVLVRASGVVQGNRATLATTQTKLARQARCSRQLANQLLGGLEQRGLLRHVRGRYEIDDLERLVAFTRQDPTAL